MIQRPHVLARGFAALLLAVLSGLSCSQYDYDSPLPGIIEIRLAVKNSRPEILEFGGIDTATGTGNFFVLNLKELEIIQPSGPRLRVYASLAAIRRDPDGDNFNTLSFEGRDSALVLGVGYAPPATYSQIVMSITSTGLVVRSSGGNIPVIDVPPFIASQDLPGPGQSVNMPVTEGRTTRVTITFDMDRSLLQRAETFDYVPYFYISSVQQF
jgi:hypothetical protein